eukprot:1458263-Prymnesium_polylepis.1
MPFRRCSAARPLARFPLDRLRASAPAPTPVTAVLGEAHAAVWGGHRFPKILSLLAKLRGWVLGAAPPSCLLNMSQNHRFSCVVGLNRTISFSLGASTHDNIGI